MTEYGLTAADLVAPPEQNGIKTASKVAPKYRNPISGQTDWPRAEAEMVVRRDWSWKGARRLRHPNSANTRSPDKPTRVDS